jgi:hypothetical protein
MPLRRLIDRPAIFLLALQIALGTQAACYAARQPGGRPVTYVTDSAKVAKALAAADIWILPQPKAVRIVGERFDLARCKGIRLAGCDDVRLKGDFAALVKERSGIGLRTAKGMPQPGFISLVLCAKGAPPNGVSAIVPDDLNGLGEEGYYLRVGKEGIVAAAATETGLYYAARTIAQMATDRTVVPGIVIRDWPSLRYRGFQYDVSRGQMPKLDALKRLARVTAEANTSSNGRVIPTSHPLRPSARKTPASCSTARRVITWKYTR